MPRFEKQSIKQLLREKNKSIKNRISLLGKTALTFPQYINAMRAVMNTAHLDQFLVQLKPDFPHLFTNAEKTVGLNSSGYKKIENDSYVYRKIVKFDDVADVPTVYTLFYFDKVEETYKVVVRQSGEDLVEKFGFDYNNDVIDSYNEGDEIKAGTVLYRSTSYSDDMLYSYSKEAVVMYSLDPYTSEDGAVIRKGFSEDSAVEMYETITIVLNGNDFMLNTHGDDENYIPLPKIGQKVKRYLVKLRRKFNDQVLFDFTDTSLKDSHPGDLIYYVKPDTEIIDYVIYDNNEETIENSFRHQLNELYYSQTQYYKEIHNVCGEIMESGFKFHRDIEYLYSRSKDMYDKLKKWKEGDSAFSDTVIEVHTRRRSPTTVGCKIVGRYGNKSVVSEVRDDEDMPYTKDGRRVDIILSLLGIINRTTSEPMNELIINHIGYQATQIMKSMESYSEKETLMFDLINDINEIQYNDFFKRYKKMTKEKQREILDEIVNAPDGNGFYFNQNNIDETIPIFYRLKEMLRKYDWIKPVDLYVNKWGREYKIMSKYYLGTMAVMRLKQDDERGFSTRGTGAVDLRSLPTRSYKSKSHLDPFSDTAIRFGEMENFIMMIGVDPEDIAMFNALYRTSYKGRRDAYNMAYSDPDEEYEITEDAYESIVVVIFNVIAKTLGFGIEFVDSDDEIYAIDNGDIKMHELDGKYYHCTDYQFFLIKRINSIAEEKLDNSPFMDKNLLYQEVEKELHERDYLMGTEDDYERLKEIERDLIFTKHNNAERGWQYEEDAIDYFDAELIKAEQEKEKAEAEAVQAQ